MSDYVCPYCGKGITEGDWWEMTPEEDYETECPMCGRAFEVSYYIDTVFTVRMPEELDVCCDCNVWNGALECCEWENPEEIAKANERMRAMCQPPVSPMKGCPLGHGERR